LDHDLDGLGLLPVETGRIDVSELQARQASWELERGGVPTPTGSSDSAGPTTRAMMPFKSFLFWVSACVAISTSTESFSLEAFVHFRGQT
jgi:hypothetical protein